MIIDYRNREAGGTWATHVAVCGYTGEDLSHLGYFYADDQAGLLKVNLAEKKDGWKRHIMADPVTGHRTAVYPAGFPTQITTADGETLFDYGDGYISPREPEIATAEIRRHIAIVPRPPVSSTQYLTGDFSPSDVGADLEVPGGTMHTWSNL